MDSKTLERTTLVKNLQEPDFFDIEDYIGDVECLHEQHKKDYNLKRGIGLIKKFEAVIAGSSSVITTSFEKIDEHNFKGKVVAIGSTSNNYISIGEWIIYADNEKLKKFSMHNKDLHCLYYYDVICKIAYFDTIEVEKKYKKCNDLVFEKFTL